MDHDLPCDLEGQTFEFLVLYEGIHVEVQQLGDDANVAPELEVSLDLDNVLDCLRVLLYDFQNGNLQFELFIKVLTLLEYFKGVVFPPTAYRLLVVDDLEHLTKGP